MDLNGLSDALNDYDPVIGTIGMEKQKQTNLSQLGENFANERQQLKNMILSQQNDIESLMNYHNSGNIQHHQQNIESMLQKGGYQTNFVPAAPPMPVHENKNQSMMSRAGASIMGFDRQMGSR